MGDNLLGIHLHWELSFAWSMKAIKTLPIKCLELKSLSHKMLMITVILAVSILLSAKDIFIILKPAFCKLNKWTIMCTFEFLNTMLLQAWLLGGNLLTFQSGFWWVSESEKVNVSEGNLDPGTPTHLWKYHQQNTSSAAVRRCNFLPNTQLSKYLGLPSSPFGYVEVTKCIICHLFHSNIFLKRGHNNWSVSLSSQFAVNWYKASSTSAAVCCQF